MRSPVVPGRNRGTCRLPIGDELEQASIRIAEVDVAAGAARSRVLVERPGHDLDAVETQMLDCFLDRPRPDEAEVAVPGSTGLAAFNPANPGPCTLNCQSPKR